MRVFQSILVVFIALYTLAKNGKEDAPSDGLKAAAEFIKTAMNLQGDACEDFNDFKCGKLQEIVNQDYPEVTGSFSYWDTQTTNFTRRIVKLLDELEPQETSTPDIFKKVKIFYDKCLTKAENQSITASLADAYTFISELGGAPMLDSSWSVPQRSIPSLVLEAQRRFGVKFGINLGVEEDKDSGNMILTATYKTSGRLPAEATSKIISTFANLTGQKTVSDEEISRQVTAMEELDNDLKEMQETLVQETSKSISDVTIRLKDLYDYDTDTAEAFAALGIPNNTDISTYDINLKTMQALKPLWNTSVYPNHRSALQNFLIGAYLKQVVTLLNVSSMVGEAEEFKWPFISSLKNESEKKESLGKMIKDLPENKAACLKLVATGSDDALLENAALRLFVETYGPAEEEALKLRNLVDLVTEKIRKKFLNAAWLDYSSKIRALNKLTSIIPRIAYPLWLKNDTAFTAHHSNIRKVQESDSYLKVLSKVKSNKWMNNILLASRPLAQDFNDFGMSSFIMNAWYQRDRNAFALSLGILQPPFYRPDYPPAMIYGIIGAIIGHEIFHGYDTSGVRVSAEGKTEDWMTDTSYDKFVDRAQCVKDQYDNFCYDMSSWKEGTDEVLCLDGDQTASENIADLDGLKAAYHAYQTFMNQNSGKGLQNTKLPGLESYSWDQIFFLSYGSVWCSVFSYDDLKSYIKYGVHSPGPSRINGTLQNLQVFSNAFNCSVGTKMNPRERCSVW